MMESPEATSAQLQGAIFLRIDAKDRRNRNGNGPNLLLSFEETPSMDHFRIYPRTAFLDFLHQSDVSNITALHFHYFHELDFHFMMQILTVLTDIRKKPIQDLAFVLCRNFLPTMPSVPICQRFGESLERFTLWLSWLDETTSDHLIRLLQGDSKPGYPTFPRPSLKSLSLQHIHGDESGCVAHHLALTSKLIGLVPHNMHLEELYLIELILNDSSLQEIGRQLAMHPTLRKLAFHPGTRPHFEPEQADEMIQYILERNPRIEFLEGTKLTRADLEGSHVNVKEVTNYIYHINDDPVFEFLSVVQSHPTIQAVNLYTLPLSLHAATTAAQLNLHSLSLCFDLDPIDPTFSSTFFDSLNRESSLRHVRIRGFSGDDNTAAMIGILLQSSSCRLESLSLEQGQPGQRRHHTGMPTAPIAMALLHNKVLVSLSLKHKHLSKTETNLFVNALFWNSSIKTFSLNGPLPTTLQCAMVIDKDNVLMDTQVASALWPFVWSKCGSITLDAMYYFIRQKPELLDRSR